MSEMPLQYLIDCYISDGEGWDVKHYSLVELMDARIRRAEAAERLAEAWLAWDENDISSATWDAYVQALAAYKDAREAVRKLEEKT